MIWFCCWFALVALLIGFLLVVEGVADRGCVLVCRPASVSPLPPTNPSVDIFFAKPATTTAKTNTNTQQSGPGRPGATLAVPSVSRSVSGGSTERRGSSSIPGSLSAAALPEFVSLSQMHTQITQSQQSQSAASLPSAAPSTRSASPAPPLAAANPHVSVDFSAGDPSAQFPDFGTPHKR